MKLEVVNPLKSRIHSVQTATRPERGNGVSKRERIIDTACSLFAKKDYHTVSMDEVADRAAIAKGTLYNYFDSKEDLYFSIVRIKLRTLLEVLRAHSGEHRDPLRDLQAFVKLFSLFLLRDLNFFVLWKKEETRKNRVPLGDCRESERQMKCLLRDILSRGIQAGTFRRLDCDAAADAILGVIDVFVNRSLHMKLSSEQRRVEQEKMFAIIINGIGIS